MFLATYKTQKNDAFISVQLLWTEMNEENETFIFNEQNERSERNAHF